MQTIKGYMEAHALQLAAEVWPVAPAKPAVIVSEGGRAWFVLQTVLRGEDDAVSALKASGFETYLPISRKDVFNKQKKITVTREFKLFNRFVFAHLPLNTMAWAPVHAIDEITGALGANGVPMWVPQSQIDRLLVAEADMKFDDTQEAKIRRKEIGRNKRETTAMTFKPGSKVRARSGPFGGFSGLVKDVTGRGAVEAMLDIFGRMTLVEFDSEMVELA